LNCVKRAVVTWQLEALEALALMMVVRSLSRLSESQKAALLRKLEDGLRDGTLRRDSRGQRLGSCSRPVPANPAV
jgi:hypothetical protein